MEKKMILPKDIELTEEVRTLYKDKDGKYYLSREGAERKLATHFECKCGNGIREKFRIFCDSCEPPEPKPQVKEWDGSSMLYVDDFDKFFSSVEDIEDYIENNCDDEQVHKDSLKIYICEGNYLHEVSSEYWEDIFPEDWDEDDLPKEIQIKLDELNQVIRDYGKPFSWSPTKYIAKIDW
jgi:hypothetical protein